MIHHVQGPPRLTAQDEAVLSPVDTKLHENGWARHATVRSSLSIWFEVADGVNAYRGGVDDYTNDLTCRDHLALAVQLCPNGATQEKLARAVHDADALFKDNTVEDVGGHLGRYFRVGDTWWWHRIPRSGELAEYLRSP